MIKPTGTLQYIAGLPAGIPGAGGTFTVDLFATDDVKGNRFEAGTIPAAAVLEPTFAPVALIAAGNAGRVVFSSAFTIVGGFIATLPITLTNNSPLAGDAVVLLLTVRVWNFANMAI